MTVMPQAYNAIQGVIERAVTRARNAPSPARPGTLRTIERNASRLFELLEEHQADHQAAGETNRLTWEAIAEDRAKLWEKAEREAAGLTTEVREAAETYLARLEEAIKPAVDAPSEERLANARSDAKLALDGFNREAVFEGLQELATDDDDAIRYLLVFTSWTKHYARSRGLGDTLPLQWEKVKDRFMTELLTEEGMAARQSLDAAHGLTEVSTWMRNAVGYYLRDQRLPGTPPPQRAGRS